MSEIQDWPTGQEVVDPKVRYTAIPRKQVSLYSQDPLTFMVQKKKVPVDPESITVTVSGIQEYNDGSPVEEVYGTDLVPTHDGVGLYSLEIPPAAVEEIGVFQARWTYVLDGREYEFLQAFEVLQYMPAYEDLTESDRSVVEQVTWMFGDLYDNTTGGKPYFAEEFQTHYGYERIAQLMQMSLTTLNLSRAPITSYEIGNPSAPFPTKWQGLLVLATYLEVLRHFCRTYVEQPSIQGTGVATTDRRDYLSRWQSILQSEQERFNQLLILFKRSHMNLSGGSLVVSGGIFGTSSYGAFPSMSTRGMRFYPASFAGWRN